MKNHTFFSSFKLQKFAVTGLLFLIFSNTNAQQTAITKQGSDTAKSCNLVIKADPFWPIIIAAAGHESSKLYSFTLENFISPHASLQLTTMLSHSSLSFPIEYNGTQIENTYILAPQLKYYLGKAKKHRGLFVGAYAEYILVNEIFNSDVQHTNNYINSIGGGIMLGAQYYIFKHLAIEALLGVGAQTVYYSFGSYGSFVNPGLIDVNIGYKF
ncbi:MAG TPA: DUF3575 domain-containing protein [Bacteroidia bacterium]|jgi:hypothetical protein|nr:DUF3575 domain-containing protein [Bacteroidia bacterium]